MMDNPWATLARTQKEITRLAGASEACQKGFHDAESLPTGIVTSDRGKVIDHRYCEYATRSIEWYDYIAGVYLYYQRGQAELDIGIEDDYDDADDDDYDDSDEEGWL